MAVARHWRNQDQRYNLAGTHCKVCGGHFFPKTSMCPSCHRRSIGKLERFQVSGNGTISSFTIIHDGMPQYFSQVPYVIAYIDLEEGDHIIGQIVDCEPSEVEIGKGVEMVFRKLSEEGRSGTIQYGFKFRLTM